ncbi:MAG: 5-oxoprolinase subunit B family protein [Actinomycetes bacterium]
MDGRLLPCGQAAVLVELADLDAVLTLDRAVRPLVGRREAAWAAVDDVVPAAKTLLVTVCTPSTLAGVRAALTGLLASLDADATGAGGEVTTTTIEVVYDGPDLAEVAGLTGLSEAEVVAAHTGTPWTVGFGGFAPGFAYLVDGDPRLEVPRRSAPRTLVPAGAVALAGTFSAVYPRASPGGWQLLGHTDTPMWDLQRTPPALLVPGHKVRFVEVGTR